LPADALLIFLPAICLQTASERSEEVKIQLHFNLNNGNLLLLTDGFCSRWCQKSLALFWGLGFVFFFGRQHSGAIWCKMQN